MTKTKHNTWVFYLILIAVIFYACGQGVNTPRKNSGFVISLGELQLVEIDSCEYLFGEWGTASVLTHKGNCKFCEERKINIGNKSKQK
jgi:hypothetical protein